MSRRRTGWCRPRRPPSPGWHARLARGEPRGEAVHLHAGAADLTPYAQQLKNSGADAAFIAWANTTNSASMWQSLQQQGVPKQMTIVTGLANRESYDALGPLVQGITLISHYVYQAPKNAVNTYLTKRPAAV